MLKELAEGETNPASLAALADRRLRATPEQLCDALGACMDLNPVYRRPMKMMLEELGLTEIMEATKWQAHSVRGFLSTAGKKRQLKIASLRNDGGDRVYKLAR